MATEEDNVNFDELVNDILENPEILLKSNLSSEQVLEIQKRLNPYAGIASSGENPDRRRIAAVSYTNLREDYLRRFTATSLIGFLFQMLQEWEVPPEQRRWKKPLPVNEENNPFKIDELVGKLESILGVAKEAQAAGLEAEKLRVSSSESSLLEAKEKAELIMADYEAVNTKYVGLLYACTHAVHKLGLTATGKLHSTALEGLKFPDVKEIINKFPLPNPPNQFEMPQEPAKAIIEGFLQSMFEFDPSVHVRTAAAKKAVDKTALVSAVTAARLAAEKSSIETDPLDPSHLTVSEVRALAPTPEPEHREAFNLILSRKEYYNTVVELLRDEDLTDAALLAISVPDKFKQYLFPVPEKSPARPAIDRIPPQDTFHRWGYYTEVNYEELRTITEAIYPEKPDLDWAIALWDTFEGTPAEVDAAFDKHCQRFQDEVPSSIKALEFGSWSLLADFKENRKKIQFYNKNTEVLKRILDRHAEDKRIGAELMRNRVKQVKAKNIAECGPDAPGLARYKTVNASQGKDVASKGVPAAISVEEMRRLEKAHGSVRAAQELELLDQYQDTITKLSELQKMRTLTDEENRDLKYALDNIDKVREMVEVPYDAIQVDVFTNDTTTGSFNKTHFYTKADDDENAAPVIAPAAAAVTSMETMD
jgi:hypothetical protein